jgi:hypothetical protein
MMDDVNKLSDDFLRTMRITVNARFEAAKRLKRAAFVSFLTTVFASLGLILIPLIDIAGINKVFEPLVLTVFQIFLAVSVLVYSSVVGAANYQVRSKDFLECADKIKTLIDDFKFDRVSDSACNIRDYNSKYRNLLHGSENHEDIDYIYALNDYNSKENYKINKKYGCGSVFLKNFNIFDKGVYLKILHFLSMYGVAFILIVMEVLFVFDMLSVSDVFDFLHSKSVYTNPLNENNPNSPSS